MISPFKKISLLMILCIVLFNAALSQNIDKSKIEEWAQPQLRQSYIELYEFLKIPNDSHFPDQIDKNIDWLNQAFQKRYFNTKVLKSSGNSSLFAEKMIDPKLKTVLFYFHLDGQAVDSSKWDQANPYLPVLKEKNLHGKWEAIDWSRIYSESNEELRIFCRSSSDDKSPIIMLLSAMDILEANNQKPSFNVKVIMDGEEEIGSPNLPEIVDNYRDVLAADMMLIFDGPRHISNRPSVFFGCRGLAEIEITVFGPKFAQHSGHYGNYAPNPALNLSQLLASMKDKEGRVSILGFYDGIKIDQKTSKILSEVPDDPKEINQKLGIAVPDKVGANYQESLQYPSLNIRGMASGWIGSEARTIVPSTATANIDIRLVVESDAEKLIGLVKDHMLAQGFYVVDHLPTDKEREKHQRIAMFTYEFGNMAFRTDFDSEIGNWVNRAMIKAFDEKPVRVRTTGGTVPISQFISKLGIEAVILPTVNLDNNQHSPNENLRIGNYNDGIKTIVSLLTEDI